MLGPPHRGFIEGPGPSENITVLSGLIRLSRREGRDLAVVFIDLAKAFDTVSHQLIDGGFVRLIEDSYRGCHSRVKTKEGPTGPLAIKLEVKQGDPLSPTLFNLSLDPLLYALDKLGRGVELGEDSTVTSLAYADDLVQLSDSWDGMAVVEAFSRLSGLKTNPKKCASFFLQHVKRKSHLNNCRRWELGGQPIKQVGYGEHIKYLGVLIEPTKGVCSPNVLETLDGILEKIKKTPLKPSQKIELLRTYALPRILYVLDHGLDGSGQAHQEIRQGVVTPGLGQQCQGIKGSGVCKMERPLGAGQGVAHFKGDKTSNFWCKDPVGAGLTESEFLIALKLRSNTFRTGSEGWSSSQADNCRLCGTQRPLAHVVSHCPNLKEQSMQNHNNQGDC
ncbi:hypothetical protein WMY93_029764 [Mugilogobius chulae]|uniref:Reverse transcriptase domain-containing protein n=1 Tax=Mugilogobius chulae TaxID=88201 RepID=A0AAW0MLX5_9GOBI